MKILNTQMTHCIHQKSIRTPLYLIQ